jgi:hypothetical protein
MQTKHTSYLSEDSREHKTPYKRLLLQSMLLTVFWGEVLRLFMGCLLGLLVMCRDANLRDSASEPYRTA